MIPSLEVIQTFIKNALAEDLGPHFLDITSKAIYTHNETTTALIKSKENGILSGAYFIEPVFKTINSELSVTLHKKEGESLRAGDVIASIDGSCHDICSGERLCLNLLQMLSGVATSTAHLSALIAHTKAKLLDTRKTTPLLRVFQKQAVLAGGGVNHRFGLYDMILIKDTHVKASNGPANAVKKAQDYCKKTKTDIAIEVEIQNIPEFSEVIPLKPDRIMLDNMSVKDMKKCVDIRNDSDPSIELEASGGINESTIRSVAETGVDFISVGALTHTIKALDIHLIFT